MGKHIHLGFPSKTGLRGFYGTVSCSAEGLLEPRFEPGLQIPDLTRFLDANRSPPRNPGAGQIFAL
jgi:hypothetical protein